MVVCQYKNGPAYFSLLKEQKHARLLAVIRFHQMLSPAHLIDGQLSQFKKRIQRLTGTFLTAVDSLPESSRHIANMLQVVSIGTLASISTAAVPGARITTVFAQLDLPMEPVTLLTAIDAVVGIGVQL